VFLSRTRRHLAVIIREITPRFAGTVTVEDAIDGSHVRESKDWAIDADPDALRQTLTGRLGPRRTRLAVASKLSLRGAATPVIKAGSAVEGGGRAAVQRVRFRVEPGHTYRVMKCVALVSDRDAPDPGAAAGALVEAASERPAAELDAHVRAWRALWDHRIEVENPRIQTLINASLYPIYAQLRDDVHWSLGPAGISGGAWGGRVFWDADLWVFPPVALLQPSLARAIVQYRANTLDGARRNARAEGRSGACIAWESAETGDEKVPIPMFHHQRHVNSDAALAQWQYVLVSGDEAYLKAHGAEVILECARYWADRVQLNAETGRYEIRGVVGSDELAEIRDNNATTNYGAAKTLRLASRVARRIGADAPEDWERIADRLHIPRDAASGRILEYEGYRGETIKQADAALLVYPYEMPMTDAEKADLVDFYRSRYPPGKIMMSSAFDGIVYCELGRRGEAWACWLDLLPHFHRPFFHVSEAPDNDVISFVTGLGGLLQLVMNGFAGIRIHDDGLQVDPLLPPGWNRMTLRGIHYGGVSFDLEIGDGGRSVKVGNFSGPAPFRLYDRAGRDVRR
jgi:trehalose/maltose hydrolase-like predicted phosphorylase